MKSKPEKRSPDAIWLIQILDFNVDQLQIRRPHNMKNRKRTGCHACCQKEPRCDTARAIGPWIDELLIGARAEDVIELTAFDEGPLPSDWAGELERRDIRVRRDILRDAANPRRPDILRDAAREVLFEYGKTGARY